MASYEELRAAAVFARRALAKLLASGNSEAVELAHEACSRLDAAGAAIVPTDEELRARRAAANAVGRPCGA